jgi:pyroglutamyl-peptidase
MTRVLITAFRPYGPWQMNASWLTLVELTRDLPDDPEITTRLYPVDIAAVREKLAEDLAEDFDVALHLGQAPGAAEIRLEAVGLNVAEDAEETPGEFFPLVPDGPVAYRSRLPLGVWARELREAGVPAMVSHHAGTYVCNAALYLALHAAQSNGLRTRAAFIHVPLDPSQLDGDAETPSLPAIASASAVRFILERLELTSSA